MLLQATLLAAAGAQQMQGASVAAGPEEMAANPAGETADGTAVLAATAAATALALLLRPDRRTWIRGQTLTPCNHESQTHLQHAQVEPAKCAPGPQAQERAADILQGGGALRQGHVFVAPGLPQHDMQVRLHENPARHGQLLQD